MDTAVGSPSRAAVALYRPSRRFFPTSCPFAPKIFADAANNGSTRSLSHDRLVVEPAHEVLDNLSSLDKKAIEKREDRTEFGGSCCTCGVEQVLNTENRFFRRNVANKTN